MSWYKSGTIGVTNGSPTVTGTGSNFIEGANIGEAVQIDDVLYEILSIESATSLTLATNYIGSTQSGEAYAIVPTQGLVANLATQVKNLITDYNDVKDGIVSTLKAGDGSVSSPSVTFNSDQNNGLYKVGEDNWGMVAGGSKIVDVSTSGIDVTGDLTIATGNVDVTGTVTMDGGSTSADFNFSDEKKALFGNGNDLKIYHSANNQSYIHETGTGDLNILASNLKLQDASGVTKLATTNDGVDIFENLDVTGTVTMDGLTVDGTTNLDGSVDLSGNLNMSSSGLIRTTDGTEALPGLRIGVDNDNGLYRPASNTIGFSTGGTERMRVDSTGIDVTGTATMDGLTVDGTDTEASVSELLKVRNSTTGEAVTIGLYAKSDNGGDGNTGSITFDAGADGSASNNELRFNADHQTNTNPSLMIKGNGDIQFFEATGSTPKLFWDASAESLGIGTDAPSSKLDIVGSTTDAIRIRSTVGADNYYQIGRNQSTGLLEFKGSETTYNGYLFKGPSSDLMVIASSGRVGIGTANPLVKTHVASDVSAGSIVDSLLVTQNTSSSTSGQGARVLLSSLNASNRAAGIAAIAGSNSNHDLAFYTNGNFASPTEKMRISDSGFVGIGTDSPASTLEISNNDQTNGATLSITNSYDESNWNAGDTIGTIDFRTDDLSTTQPIRGQIKLFDDTSPNSTYPYANAMSFSTGYLNTLNERMQISSDGNVGINTDSPASKLSVHGGSIGTNVDVASFTSATGALSIKCSDLAAGNPTWTLRSFAGEPIAFGQGTTERVRISSAGFVGIGTDSPAASLSLANSTNDSNGIKMQATGWGYYARSGINGTIGGQFIQSTNWNANTNAVDSSSQATTAIIQDATNGSIQFKTATTNTVPEERARLTSSGSLLVGTSDTPNGTSVYGAGLIPTSNDRTQLHMATSSTSNLFHVRFYNPNGAVGDIRTNGSATSYNTSSDYRLKEDAQPMSGATDRLKELKPVNFAWKADGSRVDGFLAHELQEVIPAAATGDKDGMRTEEYEVSPAVYEDVVLPSTEEVLDEDGIVITEAQEERTEQNLVSEAVMGEREVPDYQGIDQSKVVPLLTAALQEAIAKIEALESRLNALEA